jgi:hypothetical protein
LSKAALETQREKSSCLRRKTKSFKFGQNYQINWMKINGADFFSKGECLCQVEDDGTIKRTESEGTKTKLEPKKRLSVTVLNN